jgi:hypothetical protein
MVLNDVPCVFLKFSFVSQAVPNNTILFPIMYPIIIKERLHNLLFLEYSKCECIFFVIG